MISKKSYLGRRDIESFVVPGDIEIIEDWAFAHCKKLHSIFLPSSLKTVGNTVFEGCDELSKVYVYDVESVRGNVQELSERELYDVCRVKEASLIAFAIHHFENALLYDFSDVGMPGWYERFDKLLAEYLLEKDDKNYQPFLAGGEEDYEDPLNDIHSFCDRQKRFKVEGIFIRLCTGASVSCEDIKEQLFGYLSGHMQAVLDVIGEKREESLEYIKVCDNFGLLTNANIEMFLNTFEGNAYTETRAYLLGRKEDFGKEESASVWSQFEL